MDIVHYPHPALRWKSRPVTEINADLRAIVRRMFELMYEHKGIGLAANQVGLPLRLFVINLTGEVSEKDEEIVFINPEIIRRKGTETGEEGCLSLPKLYGDVRRAEKIVVEAFDLEGQGFEVSVDELAARAIQHESDHLDGILFPDRMTETAKKELLPAMSDFEALFQRQLEIGTLPPIEAIQQQLKAWETQNPTAQELKIT
jgi:peptide deformylase